MKRSVLIVILLILLSFALYLGAGESRAQGQPATIVFDMTDANKGDYDDEQEKMDPVVFGSELSAQCLLSPSDDFLTEGCNT